MTKLFSLLRRYRRAGKVKEYVEGRISGEFKEIANTWLRHRIERRCPERCEKEFGGGDFPKSLAECLACCDEAAKSATIGGKSLGTIIDECIDPIKASTKQAEIEAIIAGIDAEIAAAKAEEERQRKIAEEQEAIIAAKREEAKEQEAIAKEKEIEAREHRETEARETEQAEEIESRERKEEQAREKKEEREAKEKEQEDARKKQELDELAGNDADFIDCVIALMQIDLNQNSVKCLKCIAQAIRNTPPRMPIQAAIAAAIGNCGKTCGEATNELIDLVEPVTECLEHIKGR